MALCRQRGSERCSWCQQFPGSRPVCFFNDFLLRWLFVWFLYIFWYFYSIQKVKSFIIALLLSGRAYDSQSNYLVLCWCVLQRTYCYLVSCGPKATAHILLWYPRETFPWISIFNLLGWHCRLRYCCSISERTYSLFNPVTGEQLKVCSILNI